jgi:hypothetical protein
LKDIWHTCTLNKINDLQHFIYTPTQQKLHLKYTNMGHLHGRVGLLQNSSDSLKEITNTQWNRQNFEKLSNDLSTELIIRKGPKVAIVKKYIQSYQIPWFQIRNPKYCSFPIVAVKPNPNKQTNLELTDLLLLSSSVSEWIL